MRSLSYLLRRTGYLFAELYKPHPVTVSGMTVRYYLEKHNLKECIRDKTRKLLVPSTIGLFVFQWILGYYNMKISGAFESFESVPGIVRYVVMAISGTGVLWYIQVLWIFSMLLLLVFHPLINSTF